MAKVESNISGSPASWATVAIAGIFKTSKPGLPIVSPNTNLVSGFIADLKPSTSRGSTFVVVIPNRGKV